MPMSARRRNQRSETLEPFERREQLKSYSNSPADNAASQPKAGILAMIKDFLGL